MKAGPGRRRKLSEEQEADMIRMYRTGGYPLGIVAAMHGICIATFWNTVKRMRADGRLKGPLRGEKPGFLPVDTKS